MKVKQLIAKLKRMDPEAEIVAAESAYQVLPIRYVHRAAYLKKEKFCVLENWITDGDQKYLDTIYGHDVKTLPINAVFLTNWSGQLGE